MHDFFLERDYPPASDLQRILRALNDEFVSPDYLQRKLKLDQETLDRSLEKLITHGAAISDFNGNVRIADEPQWQDGYDAQVAARRRQIDSMMAFAEGATCRMTALVEHFGDRSDPLRSCGLCDICQPSAATGSAMRQPDASERDDLRAILTAVATRGTSTGKLFTDLALTKDRKHFDSMLDSSRPRRPAHAHQRHLPHPRRPRRHLPQGFHHPRGPHPRRRNPLHRLAPRLFVHNIVEAHFKAH